MTSFDSNKRYLKICWVIPKGGEGRQKRKMGLPLLDSLLDDEHELLTTGSKREVFPNSKKMSKKFDRFHVSTHSFVSFENPSTRVLVLRLGNVLGTRCFRSCFLFSLEKLVVVLLPSRQSRPRYG